MAGAGDFVDGEVDVAESVRRGRLVLSGWDEHDAYFAVLQLLVLAGFLAAMVFPAFLRGYVGALGFSLLLPLPLVALALAIRLFRFASAQNDLVRIDAGPDGATTRALFARVADRRGWGRVRDHARISRHFFDGRVLIVIYRRDHILVNCRKREARGSETGPRATSWPITFKERDELVRTIGEELELARSWRDTSTGSDIG